jgi:hypothetical protein
MPIDAKLKEKLLKLLSGVTTTLPKSRQGACGQLSDFLTVARDAVGKGLTAQQLNEIVVEVNRIRAVIGCWPTRRQRAAIERVGDLRILGATRRVSSCGRFSSSVQFNTTIMLRGDEATGQRVFDHEEAPAVRRNVFAAEIRSKLRALSPAR